MGEVRLPPILPVGTQVVSRVEIRGSHGRAIHPKGAVGIVVTSPVDHLHAYRVRFPDGFEASLTRAELTALKAEKAAAAGAEELPADDVMMSYVILKVVIGSRAYGLETEASDTDYRGVYLPPAELTWGLWGVPEQIERDETQEVYWELQKFLSLALKANPNVLEVLYSPLVEHATDLARELLGLRAAFLSKLVYQTYNGYILSQFKKIEADWRNKGEPKWKHMMHLLRLLHAGIVILRDGHVPVRVEDGLRERLLAVKRGEVAWGEVEDWRKQLHAEFDAAYEATNLPERPEYERVNAFLVRARRGMVKPCD
jgi:predicted nucleotidyltransferase